MPNPAEKTNNCDKDDDAEMQDAHREDNLAKIKRLFDSFSLDSFGLHGLVIPVEEEIGMQNGNAQADMFSGHLEYTHRVHQLQATQRPNFTIVPWRPWPSEEARRRAEIQVSGQNVLAHCLPYAQN